MLYESLLNWQPDALFLPEAEFAAAENVLPDPEIAAERLAVLMEVGRGTGQHIIVATRASLDQAAPKHGALESAVTQLQRGVASKMESLLERLVGTGYERVAQVTTRGQFAVRGGIVDLYSWQAPMPFRVEFFGDQIESLREFDIDTQTSVRDLKSVDVLLDQGALDQSGQVRHYVGPNDLTIDIEPEEISTGHIQISEGWIENGPEDFSGAFQDCEIGEFAVGDLVLAEAKRAQFVERLEEWRGNNAKIAIYFQTEGEIERFREIMAGSIEAVNFVEGTLARGFCFPAANLVVLSAAELFGRFAAHPRRRLRRAERNRAQIDFSELNEGDLVVHLEHGIGRFLGLDSQILVCRAGASPANRGCDRLGKRSACPTTERATTGSIGPRVRRRSEALCSTRAGLPGFPLRWRRKKIATSQLTRRRKMGPGQNQGGGFHI